METDYIKMDYSLTTCEERVEKVKEIIANTPPERLTNFYLEALGKYIVMADPTFKKHYIVTENHMVTVNRRETSFEGLVNHFEDNENCGDAIYNMITNDKNIIFYHYKKITEEEYDEIPGLRQLVEDIKQVEAQAKAAKGQRSRILHKQLTQLQKDQYVLRSMFKPQSVNCINVIKSFSKIDFTEHVTIDADGDVQSDGIISFYNPKHISALLCNYEKLYLGNWSNVQGDVKWVLEDLKNLVLETFAENPVMLEIINCKVKGFTNIEIQERLKTKFNTTYSVEHLSSLWQNRIPKLIAEKAKENWLLWHYTEEEKGYWKKCTRCGKIKLGTNRFFSKNKSSKDGLYSICKDCRNKASAESRKGVKIIRYGGNS